MSSKAFKRFSLITAAFAVLILAGMTRDIDPQLLERKYTDSTSKFITVGNKRVHYRDEGTGDLVLLLHGTASSLHAWDAWASYLKGNYRVIRMDLPGFGLTGPDADNRYEVLDDIAFIDDFADALELSGFHLVGSSLGGRIAWEYGVERPGKTKSLTLINAVGYPQESWPLPIQLGQLPMIDRVVANFQPEFMVKDALLDIYFDPAIVTDELVTRYHELARYPGNLDAFTKRVKARLDKDHLKIARITQPTLIMWGEEDRYFPLSAGKRFAEDIQRSKLVSYPNVGHLPMEEKPTQTVRAFEQFVTSLESTISPSVVSSESLMLSR